MNNIKQNHNYLLSPEESNKIYITKITVYIHFNKWYIKKIKLLHTRFVLL